MPHSRASPRVPRAPLGSPEHSQAPPEHPLLPIVHELTQASHSTSTVLPLLRLLNTLLTCGGAATCEAQLPAELLDQGVAQLVVLLAELVVHRGLHALGDILLELDLPVLGGARRVHLAAVGEWVQ